MINSNNGQPLPKQVVTVQFLRDTPTVGSSPLRLETDGKGQVRFGLPKPTPERIDVRVKLTSEHWHCSCWVMADTAKVIQQGITQTVTANSTKLTNAAPVAEATEILIAARPFTLGERLLYPFVKQ